MHTPVKPLAAAFIFIASLTTHLMAADPGNQNPPFKIGSSYLIAFAPLTPKTNIELPEGPCTIVERSENWIRIEYSTSKAERSKNDPGSIVTKETRHKAWINLNYVAALIEPVSAKDAGQGAASNP